MLGGNTRVDFEFLTTMLQRGFSVKAGRHNVADRREHPVLSSQCVTCGIAIAGLEYAFKIAAQDLCNIDVELLGNVFDDLAIVQRLELFLVPNEDYPIASLDRDRKFARGAACGLVDDDEVERGGY